MAAIGTAARDQAIPAASAKGTAQQRLLRSSRERLGRERVAEFQRARLLIAVTEVSAEQGASNATVAHIVARAGVSRRTFYELYRDSEDCFLAALDAAIEEASQRVVAAYDPSAKWQERVRSALVAVLSLLDENQAMTRLLLVESLGAGPAALDRRHRVLTRLAERIDEGRGEGRRTQNPPPLTAEGVIGGVLGVVHNRIVSQDPRPLIELVNHLVGIVVLPYRGPAAVRAELSRETPTSPARGVSATGHNPLKELHMRFTYRTVRVLSAIATNPGLSNRQLAEAAEIIDQGQISKLLARLEKLDLVANQGAGATRGEPNAWELTPRGKEVQDTLALQA